MVKKAQQNQDRNQNESIIDQNATNLDSVSKDKRTHAGTIKSENGQWQCSECACPENLTPVKRIGKSGKRDICNACYIRSRAKKDKDSRGSARPTIFQGSQLSYAPYQQNLVSMPTIELQPYNAVSYQTQNYNALDYGFAANQDFYSGFASNLNNVSAEGFGLNSPLMRPNNLPQLNFDSRGFRLNSPSQYLQSNNVSPKFATFATSQPQSPIDKPSYVLNPQNLTLQRPGENLLVNTKHQREQSTSPTLRSPRAKQQKANSHPYQKHSPQKKKSDTQDQVSQKQELNNKRSKAMI